MDNISLSGQDIVERSHIADEGRRPVRPLRAHAGGGARLRSSLSWRSLWPSAGSRSGTPAKSRPPRRRHHPR